MSCAGRLEGLRQGDTWRLRLRFPAGTDLTGYAFWLTLKRDFADADADAVLQVATVAGASAGDEPLNGIVHVVASAPATTQVPPGRYVYDVQVRAANGEIRTVLPAWTDYDERVEVLPQVTQALA